MDLDRVRPLEEDELHRDPLVVLVDEEHLIEVDDQAALRRDAARLERYLTRRREQIDPRQSNHVIEAVEHRHRLAVAAAVRARLLERDEAVRRNPELAVARAVEVEVEADVVTE